MTEVHASVEGVVAPRGETLREVLQRRFTAPRNEQEQMRWLFEIPRVERPPPSQPTMAAAIGVDDPGEPAPAAMEDHRDRELTLRERVELNRRRLFGVRFTTIADEDDISDASNDGEGGEEGRGPRHDGQPRHVLQIDALHDRFIPPPPAPAQAPAQQRQQQPAEPAPAKAVTGGGRPSGCVKSMFDGVDHLVATHVNAPPVPPPAIQAPQPAPAGAPRKSLVLDPALMAIARAAKPAERGGGGTAAARLPGQTIMNLEFPPQQQRDPRPAGGAGNAAATISVEELFEAAGAGNSRRSGVAGGMTPSQSRRLSIGDAERLLDGMAPSQHALAAPSTHGSSVGVRRSRGSGGSASHSGVLPQVAAIEEKLNRDYDSWASGDHRAVFVVKVVALRASCTLASLHGEVVESNPAAAIGSSSSPRVPQLAHGAAVEVMMPLSLRRELGVVVGHHLAIGAPFFLLPARRPALCTILTTYAARSFDPGAVVGPRFRYPGLADGGGVVSESLAGEPFPAQVEPEQDDAFAEGPGPEWHVPLAVLQMFRLNIT